MKKNIVLVILLLLFLSVGFAEKPLFEYGSTQIFSNSTSYDDGYDKNGLPLERYNVRSELTRYCVTGYMNFNENSRIRASVDYGGFYKHSSGFNESSWVFLAFLYYEQMKFMGIDSVKIGLFGTPWANWEDKIWNYRVISRSLLNDQGMTNPQDRGIGFESKINDKWDYALSFTSGQGIFGPEIDKVTNTEYRLTYALTDAVKVSFGGGSGAKAIDYGYPQYYSYTTKYGVRNIYYKASQFVLSYTFVETYKLDDDFSVNGVVKKTAGETRGKASSITGVYNLLPIVDILGRLDTIDNDIQTGDDVTRKSICGVAFHQNDNLKIALTKQALRSEAANTATHTTNLDIEVKF